MKKYFEFYKYLDNYLTLLEASKLKEDANLERPSFINFNGTDGAISSSVMKVFLQEFITYRFLKIENQKIVFQDTNINLKNRQSCCCALDDFSLTDEFNQEIIKLVLKYPNAVYSLSKLMNKLLMIDETLEDVKDLERKDFVSYLQIINDRKEKPGTRIFVSDYYILRENNTLISNMISDPLIEPDDIIKSIGSLIKTVEAADIIKLLSMKLDPTSANYKEIRAHYMAKIDEVARTIRSDHEIEKAIDDNFEVDDNVLNSLMSKSDNAEVNEDILKRLQTIAVYAQTAKLKILLFSVWKNLLNSKKFVTPSNLTGMTRSAFEGLNEFEKSRNALLYYLVFVDSENNVAHTYPFEGYTMVYKFTKFSPLNLNNPLYKDLKHMINTAGVQLKPKPINSNYKLNAESALFHSDKHLELVMALVKENMDNVTFLKMLALLNAEMKHVKTPAPKTASKTAGPPIVYNYSNAKVQRVLHMIMSKLGLRTRIDALGDSYKPLNMQIFLNIFNIPKSTEASATLSNKGFLISLYANELLPIFSALARLSEDLVTISAGNNIDNSTYENLNSAYNLDISSDILTNYHEHEYKNNDINLFEHELNAFKQNIHYLEKNDVVINDIILAGIMPNHIKYRIKKLKNFNIDNELNKLKNNSLEIKSGTPKSLESCLQDYKMLQGEINPLAELLKSMFPYAKLSFPMVSSLSYNVKTNLQDDFVMSKEKDTTLISDMVKLLKNNIKIPKYIISNYFTAYQNLIEYKMIMYEYSVSLHIFLRLFKLVNSASYNDLTLNDKLKWETIKDFIEVFRVKMYAHFNELRVAFKREVDMLKTTINEQVGKDTVKEKLNFLQRPEVNPFHDPSIDLMKTDLEMLIHHLYDNSVEKSTTELAEWYNLFMLSYKDIMDNSELIVAGATTNYYKNKTVLDLHTLVRNHICNGIKTAAKLVKPYEEFMRRLKKFCSHPIVKKYQLHKLTEIDQWNKFCINPEEFSYSKDDINFYEVLSLIAILMINMLSYSDVIEPPPAAVPDMTLKRIAEVQNILDQIIKSTKPVTTATKNPYLSGGDGTTVSTEELPRTLPYDLSDDKGKSKPEPKPRDSKEDGVMFSDASVPPNVFLKSLSSDDRSAILARLVKIDDGLNSFASINDLDAQAYLTKELQKIFPVKSGGSALRERNAPLLFKKFIKKVKSNSTAANNFINLLYNIAYDKEAYQEDTRFNDFDSDD